MQLLTQTVQKAARDSSNPYKKGENHQTKVHLSLHVRYLIEHKRRAQKIWQST